MKYTISARRLANPDHVSNRSSCGYHLHCQSEDSHAREMVIKVLDQKKMRKRLLKLKWSAYFGHALQSQTKEGRKRLLNLKWLAYFGHTLQSLSTTSLLVIHSWIHT